MVRRSIDSTMVGEAGSFGVFSLALGMSMTPSLVLFLVFIIAVYLERA